ncbi:MAG: penicillin-binding protein [Flavobacteriales bacterium CG_4_9_14_3_um_filter_32_8]|nr:MAG: penicillin-binding protein [Flavobacteriales bacterium CG_4_9_14_3_um_filter_32_8]
MFKLFFSKTFLINIAITILLAVLVIFGVLKFIDNYTHHNETISVPSLEGLTISEAEEVLKEKNLRYSILDSVYIANVEKGIVVEQDPAKGDLVKEKRTIYITTSKITPPKTQMPQNIIGDNSVRIAIAKLESLGFRIGKLSYIPSVDKNVVLKMDIKGKAIKNGDWILKNSVINLTIGSGLSGENVIVPYLINLTLEEATSKLLEAFLNIGFSDYSSCTCTTKEDTLNARVYKQSPVHSQSVAINMGSSVDLYFTNDPSIINFNPPIDSISGF